MKFTQEATPASVHDSQGITFTGYLPANAGGTCRPAAEPQNLSFPLQATSRALSRRRICFSSAIISASLSFRYPLEAQDRGPRGDARSS